MSGFVRNVYIETGLQTWIASPSDVKILTLLRYVRLFAYGGSTIILALFLSSLKIPDQKIGLFMTLTLLGDVAISLVLTVIADRVGRRRMLAFGALLMTISGVVFALCSNYWLLVLASVLGVISPSGNEIGPFKAIEESTISHLTRSSQRSGVLTWYIIAGLCGTASGTIISGWVVQQLQVQHSWSAVDSYRVVFWASRCEPDHEPTIIPEIPSSSTISETSTLLPQEVETEPEAIPKHQPAISLSASSWLPSLSQETQGIMIKLCFLFAIDSLASGLAPVTWMAYFFNHKFGLSEGRLGSLFFAASILSSSSNLLAPSLARRLGLIKTMVFTHIPASLALAAIPVPNQVGLAVMFLLFRASTNSMDQAPRQAFLAAAVRPSERTAVMGLVNVVKTLSQSAGPVGTGILANHKLFGLAFIIAGALKILYDILMLAMFLGYKTIEERAEENVEAEAEAEWEGADNVSNHA